MATACDTAQYILECSPLKELSAIKLEKLVYYCQSWCLAWTGKPLFEDEIQAWANGPVTPNLYAKHRAQLNVSSGQGIGDSSKLSAEEKEIIDAVLPTYMDKEPFWLVELTHMESPWKDARGGCPAGAVCKNVISHAAMAEYYTSILA